MGNLGVVILIRPVDRIQSHGCVQVFRGGSAHPRLRTPPRNCPTSGSLSGGQAHRCHLAPHQHGKVGLLLPATRGEEIRSRSLLRRAAPPLPALRALAQRP